MSTNKSLLYLSVVLAMGIVGCQDNADTHKTNALKSEAPKVSAEENVSEENATILTQFDEQSKHVNFSGDHSQLSFLLKNGQSGEGKGRENQALKVDFLAKSYHEPGFTITPKSAWQWQSLADFRIAVDIKNDTDIATHLFVQVGNEKGQVHNRSVNIPEHSSKTYHIELKGIDLEIESGIRSNPLAWPSNEVPFIWRWGEKNIDLSAVNRLTFSVNHLLEDRQLVFSNMRLLKNPPRSTQYLSQLSDEFGQRLAFNAPYDVASVEELKAMSQAELATLDNKLMPDRSRFGGWKNGPKLKATGYFRTEKIKGKWSLVDPEGYLYFSTGIANVRMANTSTITGIDFDPSTIVQRSKDDLTPEDSLGLNPVSAEALKTAYVASELRRNMFSWLPKYDEPLAKHYGYRRTVHQGALEHGETYSFYQANLERKYGENYMDTWKEVTVKRMRNWGFTSFGNWIDPQFYHDDQVPYFANGWIIGDFKTVSSGNDLWSPLPDPFDPEFAVRARVTLEQISEEVKNNPWCVGVFIDNEKSWGSNTSNESRYAVVINTLRRADKDSPTKAHFTQMMKQKYSTISALNTAWNSEISSWDEFSQATDLKEFTQIQLNDYASMSMAYANEYFKIVNSELKRVLPNHMYMGVRFASWGMTTETLAAAQQHVDVMSYNIYKEGVHPNYWQFLEDIDMPSIIGEFHMGAMDTGLINPGLVHAETQEDRSQQYVNYMGTVVDNPYFVGAHWFQYIDSPLTGRAYDGENYNVGFVNVTDTPYKPMIDAVKGFNQALYPRRFNNLEEK